MWHELTRDFQSWYAHRHEWRDADLSDADIEAIVEAYDQMSIQHQLLLGIRKLMPPAYGWIQSLNTTDDHKIEAAPEQVDAAFAELVEAGRYKKISASFFGPDVAGNPVPGTYYLKHVGFLGATAPAVKGLNRRQLCPSRWRV